MDLSVSLDMDRSFRDFNLCVYWGPSLNPRDPFPESWLVQSAYRIRKGDASDLAEFADALVRTIRPETFQAFQKIHGPRPISYSDWYCTKLEQFFGILLYQELRVLGPGPHGGWGPPQTERPWEEGILSCEPALIQRDAIERAFPPAEVNQVDWLAAIERLAAAGPRGRDVLEEWLAGRTARRKRRPTQVPDGRPGQLTRKTPYQGKRRGPRLTRDTMIRSWLEAGVSRDQICPRLDRASIATTPAMQKRGLTWSEGWEDPKVKKNIQTLFTKARKPD